MSKQTVGVVGAGVMGVGVAQNLIQTGHRVLLLDVEDVILRKARESITNNIRLQWMFHKKAAQESSTRSLAVYEIPFAFFGHSLGALVSFELARQLRKQGCLGPQLLLVSSHRAPHIPDRDSHIYALPDSAFIEQLRRFNGTPESALQDQELMKLLLPLLRADLEIYETYTYTCEAPLDCTISALGGLDDWRVTREDLAAWKEQASGDFSLRMFAGDHFFLQTAPEAVLQAISQDLRRLLSRLV